MKLEQLLSEQGSDPLTDKLNGRPLRAFINANLKKVGIESIQVETPCDVILERIYGIDDQAVQDAILNRAVSELKSDLNYKQFSMYGALLLAVIAVGLLVTGGNLSPEVIDALKSIALAILNLIGDKTAIPT